MKDLTLKEMAERYAREREKRAAYYRKNREKRLAYQRAYDKANPRVRVRAKKGAKRGQGT